MFFNGQVGREQTSLPEIASSIVVMFVKRTQHLSDRRYDKVTSTDYVTIPSNLSGH